MSKCYCGINLVYESCCGRLIDEGQQAQTPEQLMRSRYSAYVQANIDYIVKTMQGNAALGFEPESSQKWAESVQWLGLKVFDAYLSKESADIGFVSFEARYKDKNNIVHCLAEISQFRKINGQWFYTDGKIAEKINKTVYTKQNLNQKVGRNDACFCGSGKKYKKCCYLTAKQQGESHS